MKRQIAITFDDTPTMRTILRNLATLADGCETHADAQAEEAVFAGLRKYARILTTEARAYEAFDVEVTRALDPLRSHALVSFHAILLGVVGLYSAAQARGDVQAARYYSVTMHTLLAASGANMDEDWTDTGTVELSEDRAV